MIGRTALDAMFSQQASLGSLSLSDAVTAGDDYFDLSL
jgi:hypothetical protein